MVGIDERGFQYGVELLVAVKKGRNFVINDTGNGKSLVKKSIIIDTGLVETIYFDTQKNFIFDLCYEPAELQTLDIVFPSLAEKIDIYLSPFSTGSYQIYSNNFDILEEKDIDVGYNLLENGSLHPISLYNTNNGIKSIRLKGNFILSKICALSTEAAQRQQHDTKQEEHLKNDLTDNLRQGFMPLWKPNHRYKIQVNSEIRRRKVGSTTEETAPFIKTYYFKTFQPPGVFGPGLPEAAEQIKEDTYPFGPLKDLGPYIEATIPKQAAANERRPRHFRNYDLGIIYKESATYLIDLYGRMEGDFDLRLKLYDHYGNQMNQLEPEVKERQLRAEISDSLVGKSFEASWISGADRSGSDAAGIWYDHDFGQTIDLPVEDRPKTGSLYFGGPDFLLLPNSIYEAKLFSGEHIVYNFSFTTSRFVSFEHMLHTFEEVAWNYHQLEGRFDQNKISKSGVNAALKDWNSRFPPSLYDLEQAAE